MKKSDIMPGKELIIRHEDNVAVYTVMSFKMEQTSLTECYYVNCVKNTVKSKGTIKCFGDNDICLVFNIVGFDYIINKPEIRMTHNEKSNFLEFWSEKDNEQYNTTVRFHILR